MAAARARPARRSASATRCHRRTSTVLAATARPRQPAYGEIDGAVDTPEAPWPTRLDATQRVVAGAVQRRPRQVEAVVSAGESSTGKGKRRPRRVSVTTSLATATPATRPAPCFAPRGRSARRREVPRSHSVSGRGGAIRPRTGEPRYFLSLYRRPVRRRRRNHTTAPCRPATEDIKHLH